MSGAIQARIQELIQILPEFDEKDVTLGDYLILSRGSAPYVIIRPGPFQVQRRTHNPSMTVIWTYYLDVITNFRDDDYSEMDSARESLIKQFNIYTHQTLDRYANITRALIERGDELFYLYPQGGGDNPQFAGQALVMSVTEEYDEYST